MKRPIKAVGLECALKDIPKHRRDCWLASCDDSDANEKRQGRKSQEEVRRALWRFGRCAHVGKCPSRPRESYPEPCNERPRPPVWVLRRNNVRQSRERPSA